MGIVFGVDIGGTTIKMGVFSEMGRLLEKFEIRTETKVRDVFIDIAEKVKEKILKYNEECIGVGVGLPGPVDDMGNVYGCVNLNIADTFNVQEKFKDLLPGIKIKGTNDANAAAFGEYISGSGKGYENMVLITLGTGVGSGIITKGKILNGSNGGAGEIGHIFVERLENKRCNCGKKGCLEQYASSTGILNMAKEQLIIDKRNDLEYSSTKDVIDSGKNGDITGLKIMEKFGDYMGAALSYVAEIINTDCFVFGGGVSKSGDFILGFVEKYFKEYTFSPCSNVDFRLAELGNDAGIYGACGLIIRN